MRISVKLEASENRSHHTFDLEDLGFTEQEWSEMSGTEKEEAINKAASDLPEQPYWCVDTFDEID